MEGKNLLQEPEPEFNHETTDEYVVLEESYKHKGAMHMLIESGGSMPIGKLFGIRIIPRGNNMNCLQLVTMGHISTVGHKIVPRPKMVKPEKPKQESKIVDFIHKDEELF